jgi:SAM-dependent methyltransferase
MMLDRRVHNALVHQRRVRVLARHLSELIPANVSVLDVGSGDGLLASRVLADRSDLKWVAIDPLARPKTHVPVHLFDGDRLPFADKEFDFVLFVDVLHHTDAPMVWLREAVRVARTGIVIKDHLREGLCAGPTLRLMDWLGNAAWGVRLPYNYWDSAQWKSAREKLSLQTEEERVALGLYPWWANWLFGRSLHFIARLRLSRTGTSDGKVNSS